MSTIGPATGSEVGFRELTHADPRPTLLVSVDGRILAANPAARRACSDLATGRSLLECCPAPADDLRAYLRRCARQREPLPGSLSFEADGAVRTWRCDGAGVGSGDDRVIIRLRPRSSANERFLALSAKVAELNREVEHRLGLQRDLEKALASNEVLLREVQHRVNNNFQVLLSTFALAARGVRDEQVREELAAVSRRVQAMATVQHMLHDLPGRREVDCRATLEQIVESVRQSYSRPEILVRFEVAQLQCDIDTAMTLGLLTNELLSNAYKHAYPDGRSGVVTVSLAAAPDGTCTYSVADDGVEFDGSIVGTGHGHAIACALAAKLGGTLGFERGAAKAFTVVFAWKQADQARPAGA